MKLEFAARDMIITGSKYSKNFLLTLFIGVLVIQLYYPEFQDFQIPGNHSHWAFHKSDFTKYEYTCCTDEQNSDEFSKLRPQDIKVELTGLVNFQFNPFLRHYLYVDKSLPLILPIAQTESRASPSSLS